ncbi:MAG: PEP-CTERM sorting domain-containing protein [Halioglobus sp.]|nr:PEP-CTERM sorting domain-containing protein [Halioglobus sp.]
MKTKLLTILTTFVLAGPMAANAALIGSYGTGSSGAAVGGTFTSDNIYVYDTNNAAYFQGATTPASNWVWGVDPDKDATINFTFSFDLTGYDLSTVSITGLWGADNFGSVFLNGNTVSALPAATPKYTNFRTLTAFTASDVNFFNQGINNLVYSITNDGAAGAFRAAGELFADASGPNVAPSAVPAPASAMLVLLGLAGFGVRKRRNA